ncbi:MAG: protein kinase [Planctomycetota bacterium]
MSLLRGSKLGPYEILDRLGAGGMSEVYLARDPRLQRQVAIKVLAEYLRQNEDISGRFERENRAVAALSHPNIRAIYDVGTDAGQAFAVMELLEGETLAERLDRSPMDWREALPIALAVACGLAAAHEAGFVHRDIKPKNIFLTKTGAVKLLDFGLVHLESQSERHASPTVGDESTLSTQLGAVLGTPAYMSPEQVRGEPADARSDIFSFGSVLYEMLTGTRPFKGDSSLEIMAAILRDEPPYIAHVLAGAPAEIERIFTHCLKKDPDQRIQSAADLAFRLRGLEKTAEERTHSEQGLDRSWTGSSLSISGAPQRAVPSIAVLPFINLSPEPENQFFTDGLAEELINAFCKIGRLRVASRTSSFAFRNRSQDVREIGRRLNVGAVMEGSVRKVGRKLRITAQLVEVPDGYHVWSETYDREMQDVFAVQSEIAHAIADAMEVVLTAQERRALSTVPTASIPAYECYLQGRQLFHQFRYVALQRACTLFQKACEFDPRYAAAYAGLAECNAFLYSYWGHGPRNYLDDAMAASRRAVELAPEDAQAHVSRGLSVSLNKDYDEAQNEFEAAIRLEPASFDAHYIYARVCYEQGKLEKALQLFEQSSRIKLDDYEAACLATTVLAGLKRRSECEVMGRHALDRITKHLELYPQDGRALYMGAIVSVHLGEKQRGLEWAERALTADPNEPLVRYNVACTYALLGQVEKALDCLERAVDLGGSWLAWGENDPDLNSLRNHSRFKAILDRMRTSL